MGPFRALALPRHLRELRSVAAAVLDRDGRLLDANAGYHALDGAALREPDLAWLRERAAAAEAGDDGLAPVHDGALLLAAPDGATVAMTGRVHAHADGFLLVAERDPAGARGAERLASLAGITEGMSHQINSPLTYVITYLDLAMMALDKAMEDPEASRLAPDLPTTRAAVAAAAEGAVRVGRLARHLRRVGAAPGLLATESADVAGVLARVEADVRRQPARGVDLAFASGPGEMHARGGRDELREILLSLVHNAADAAARGGGHVRVEARERDGHVEVTVSDDGPGVPVEMRARLFTPFFTTKADGTGLNLALAKVTARSYGGDVLVGESAEGGAAFTVRLPACARRTPA